MSHALQGTELTFRYGTQAVLTGVSLTVAPGELLAIVGPNGAGKSTLLKLLSGELKPQAGAVTLEGRNLHDASHWPARALAKRRAVLPQEASLSFGFTVRELVRMGRYAHSPDALHPIDHSIVNEAMVETGTHAFAERRYTELSGGERQRVQLARVLAQVWPSDATSQPNYLLLDEPVSNLDLSYQHLALQLARRRAENGLGVCVVLHDLNLALRYADQCLVLQGGQVATFGPAKTVLTPDTVASVFCVEAARVSSPFGDCLVTHAKNRD